MKVYWLVLRSEYRGGLGFGITARDWDDAMLLLAEAGRVCLAAPVDATMIKASKEITSIDELDQGHVVSNMGSMLCRGVWFPNLPNIQ
jgi:hypothetical protein